MLEVGDELSVAPIGDTAVVASSEAAQIPIVQMARFGSSLTRLLNEMSLSDKEEGMGGGGTGGGLLEWQRQLFDHLTCLIEYECVGMYPKELRLLQQGGWPPYALLSSEPTEDHEDLDYVKEVLEAVKVEARDGMNGCLLYTSPSPRDATLSRMPSSA